ncbi:MAG: hypothetical protein LUQ04_08320 [Methanoregula sp.]|nr:hypothetical protein [Methanoregula sp.]
MPAIAYSDRSREGDEFLVVVQMTNVTISGRIQHRDATGASPSTSPWNEKYLFTRILGRDRYPAATHNDMRTELPVDSSVRDQNRYTIRGRPGVIFLSLVNVIKQ